MSAPLAHIAGIPVEETALMFAPVWTGAAVILSAHVRRARRGLRWSRRRRNPQRY
jgi:hypothetical protein